MKRTIANALICLAITFLFPLADAKGQVSPSERSSLADLARGQLELKKEPFEEKRELLFNQYADAVDRLAKGFQKSADLENVIKARKEAENARATQVTGTETFEGVDRLRQALRRELELISEAETAAMGVQLTQMIKLLESQKTELTRAGKIEEALEVDAALKELAEDSAKLSASPRSDAPPEVKEISIELGEKADRVLSKVDPRKNLARKGTIEASSAFEHRQPENIIKSDRPDKLAELSRDEWAMTSKTGWIQLNWDVAVPVKAIVLVNRLTGVGSDRWIESRILINGTAVGEIADFGGKMLALIELKAEVPVKSIRLEILRGTQAPGLTSFEVYSALDF